MSEQRKKPSLGRGRGKPNRPSEGPWSRSKKLDESIDVRPPKKDNEEFSLTESSFPPLPGVQTSVDGQLEDAESSGPSLVNGRESQEQGAVPQISQPEAPTMNIPTDNRHEQGAVPQISKPEAPTMNRPTTDNQHEQGAIPRNRTEAPTMNSPTTDNRRVDVENSNLSPFAAEFVPRGLNMNPEAQAFVPTNGNFDETNNNRGTSQSSASNINVHDTDAVLADLEETVTFCYSKLIETPGSFDELIGVVTPHYIKYMENPDLPTAIVNKLFTIAIQDPNFSYFAVKILIHLIQQTTTEDNHELRDVLLRHTQSEVDKIRMSDLQNVSSTSEFRPFLTFLSELYIQLEIAGRRLHLIGQALVDTLEKLLHTDHIPVNERMKLVVNMLKLTGLSLDEDNPGMLNVLMNDLSFMLNQHRSNLDNQMSTIVGDLILLRNLRWGLVEPEDDEFGVEDQVQEDNYVDTMYDPNQVYATGVFYGPDGHPIAYEEQMFLEVETSMHTLNVNDQGEPSPDSIEGFDEAYEEFLQTVPKHPQNHH